jgi:hypothetical protein
VEIFEGHSRKLGDELVVVAFRWGFQKKNCGDLQRLKYDPTTFQK